MQNETLSLVVVFRADKYRPCIEYVFNLFARVYGYRCSFVPEDEPSPPGDAIIHYSTHHDRAESTLGANTVSIDRGPFFHGDSAEAFGNLSGAPAHFSELLTAYVGTAFNDLAQRSGSTARITRDFIAASFILLSGYYDWILKERDAHGRVTSNMVPLPPETWDKPVVNHWFRQLDELIRGLRRGDNAAAAPTVKVPGIQTMCLTHDVDLMRKYTASGAVRHLARTARHNRKSLKREFSQAGKVLTGRARDPYDSFDQLYTVKERISAPSTYFFMGSNPGGANGDYRIGDRNTRALLTRARMYGDETGMHGSWESRDNPGMIQAEKSAVETAARTSVTGARQHYLRFSTPATWNHLADAGIRYDSSGGFPDRCGFKYGWSGCFQPFDLDALKTIDILEIPLVCMDVTLAIYEKIPAELALERLTNLFDASCEDVPGGAFVFLWHNIMGDRAVYPGYWDTFEYFFSVASGSARFITLSQLCDEYEQTR